MEFYRQLPLKARMGEFGGREFYGPMPGKINAVSKGQYTFEDGTFNLLPNKRYSCDFLCSKHSAAFEYGRLSNGQSHIRSVCFNELKSYEVF